MLVPFANLQVSNLEGPLQVATGSLQPSEVHHFQTGSHGTSIGEKWKNFPSNGLCLPDFVTPVATSCAQQGPIGWIRTHLRRYGQTEPWSKSRPRMALAPRNPLVQHMGPQPPGFTEVSVAVGRHRPHDARKWFTGGFRSGCLGGSQQDRRRAVSLVDWSKEKLGECFLDHGEAGSSNC